MKNLDIGMGTALPDEQDSAPEERVRRAGLRQTLRRLLIDVADAIADAIEGREHEVATLPRRKPPEAARRDGATAFDRAFEQAVRGGGSRGRRKR